MLRNLNQSAGGKRILGVPQVGVLAEQILAETATGDSGPGILYNEALQSEYAGKYLRARVLDWPAVGSLVVRENGAYEASGLPDGLHSFSYELYVDGALQAGTAEFTIAVGVVDATAAGATLTGTSTLSAGSASGQQNATAPGAALTGDASLSPGAASAPGMVNANAPGANLSGSSSISPGTASGQIVVFYPAPADVRLGVTYGPTGTEYVGTMTAGTGEYPTAAEIAAAVRSELAVELDRLTKLAALSAIDATLVVTPTSRTAGTVSQTIVTAGDTTTVQ